MFVSILSIEKSCHRSYSRLVYKDALISLLCAGTWSAGPPRQGLGQATPSHWVASHTQLHVGIVGLQHSPTVIRSPVFQERLGNWIFT